MTQNRRHLFQLSLGACVVFSVLTQPSHAHQQWIDPNFTFSNEESAWLSFDHTFGDQRFRTTSGPGNYYSWWLIGPDGFKKSIPSLFLGKTRTVGEVELKDPGTYRIEGVENRLPWTRLKREDDELWQPGTRADYRNHEVIRSTIYFSKSVSYVSLKTTSDNALAGEGDPLEIVFEDHPNSLKVGQTFHVKALAFGTALDSQEITVFSEHTDGHDATHTCTTNTNGLCAITVKAPGRYLLPTQTEGKHKNDTSTDGYSRQYSVLVEVNPSDTAHSH